MTEIPEHLLKRSQARKAAAGGGDPAATPAESSTAPATTESSAVAPAAKAAPVKQADAPRAKKPEPVPPYVDAALKRKRIPIWTMPVLALLPIWAVIYAVTLTSAGEKKPTQLELGTEVYAARCASCHGADGSGGVGRPFKDGEIVKTFPKIEDHLEFVWVGSPGIGPEGTPYGDPEREGGQHMTLSFNGTPMPAFSAVLSQEELLAVVRYEREVLGGETPDPATIAEDESLTHEDGSPRLDEAGETLITADGSPLFGDDGKLAASD